MRAIRTFLLPEAPPPIDAPDESRRRETQRLYDRADRTTAEAWSVIEQSRDRDLRLGPATAIRRASRTMGQ